MFRFTDEIQIDKAYHRAKQIIASHQEEIARLREEITQLRNRPEPDVAPLLQKSGGLHVTVSEKHLQDPLKDWKTGHFIRYFEHKFVGKYRETFPLRKEDWKLYSIRIKMFRDTNAHFNLTDNETFKRYIDWCFDQKFNKKFVASIYALASLKLLTDFRINIGVSQKPTSYVDLITKIPKTKADAKADLIKDAF